MFTQGVVGVVVIPAEVPAAANTPVPTGRLPSEGEITVPEPPVPPLQARTALSPDAVDAPTADTATPPIILSGAFTVMVPLVPRPPVPSQSWPMVPAEVFTSLSINVQV